jgi:multisubunit Na+/H+ antiporter MnhC subunit
LSADERLYEATVAVQTAAATIIVLCFVFMIVMNALNKHLIGLIISNNAIETRLFSIK